MIQIAYNAVDARVIRAPQAALVEINRVLSYRVTGSEHMTAFKSGSWSGASSFLTWGKEPGSGHFPAGFVPLVLRALRAKGFDFQSVGKPAPEPLGPLRPEVDAFGYSERYDYQPETIDALIRHGKMIAQVATGGGKCLGRDTPVMMFDGTIKAVQNVVTGDLLMGPDSLPRSVLSTCVGVGPLYRVTPTKGDPYVVNDAHILSLKKTSRGYRGKSRNGEKYPKGEVVNVNVEDFLAQTPTFRHTHKGWRAGVEFAGCELPVSPYLLGVILGDGTINGSVSVTTADPEILTMLEGEAAAIGIRCNVIPRDGNKASAVYFTQGKIGRYVQNPLMAKLRSIGLKSKDNKAVEKFIPHIYKTAARKDRLELLAGVIDTDGHYDGKGMYLTLKEERLFDDVLFVARSLGFAAYKKRVRKTCCNNGVVGDYFAMVISGNLDQIPTRIPRKKANPRLQKKDPLVTGLSVESIGEGEYFGFEIDGDHLFLLGDFTVTHNTRIAKFAYRRINRPTLFLTTRGILMHQMRRAVVEMGEEVAVLGDGEWGIKYRKADGSEGRRATKFCVGMVQTLSQRLEEKTEQAELLALRERRAVQLSKFVEGVRKKLLSAGTLPHLVGERVDALARAESDRLAVTEVEIAGIRASVAKHNKLRLATMEFLQRFELVIAEEAHELSGTGFYTVMAALKNAHYRLALTATPFMKDDEEANMRLLASCGPVAIKITEKMLIDRGILARPYFKWIKLDESRKPKSLTRSTPYQKAYAAGVVNYEHRNKLISAEVMRAWRYGLNSMVLVQHKAHGAILESMLTGFGMRAAFIDGDSSQEERDLQIGRLASGELDVLIGSTILDVGVDVPSVGMIVLAGGGKAEVALRQRIGRGLREKKNGFPNVAFIVDIYDEFNNHLKAHCGERQYVIKNTPGFGENIVADFDYKGLGFELARQVA